MEPLFYVIAILGCGDGSAQCSEARVAPARYATIQQCQAAMPAALLGATDVDAPVVSAACRANGPRMVDASKARNGG